MATLSNTRLLALDVLRGLTLAGMILVNNPGSWSHVYAPLLHAESTGCTLADLVFPFFMFVMGFSIPLSMQKFGYECSGKAVKKILKRSVLLFLIGLAFSLFFMLAGEFRWLGVLQRLAISYGITAILLLTIKPKRFPLTIAVILVSYWWVVRCYGSYLLTHDQGILFDSEGLVSTPSAIAHVMIGALLSYRVASKSLTDKIRTLLLWGVISLAVASILILTGDILSKKIWSPSFVFLTTGLAECLLALLLWVIDIRGWSKGWCTAFRVFGINPLAMYIIALILEIIVNVAGLTEWVFTQLCKFSSPSLASLVYAILFVLFNWCIAYCFYRKGKVIKL